MLSKEQCELLAKMTRDNKGSGMPFEATSYWQEVVEVFQSGFEREGLDSELKQYYNEHFGGMYWNRTNIPYYVKYMGGDKEPTIEYACDLLRARIEERFDFFVCLDTWDELTALETFYLIRENIPRVHSVAELGAGWGRVPLTFAVFYSDILYTIYDIPESLIISHECLSHLSYAHSYGERPRTDSPGLYFLGAQELQYAEPVDLIITIATLQEMTQEQIDAYMSIFRQKCKYLYSLQRIQGTKYYPDDCEFIYRGHPLWSNQYEEVIIAFG